MVITEGREKGRKEGRTWISRKEGRKVIKEEMKKES
jgi:hypothetical protein